MRTTLYDYCREHSKPQLLREWHPSKNAPLTPRDVTYGSNRSVWWRCEKGHEWQTMVYTRTGGGSGCPYCAGKKAWPGENDLASLRPDLAAQWHPEKNGGITPADVCLGSHHKAWWICKKGHEWQAIVKSRAIAGTGCPVCANRVLIPGENDLATTHPDLARQWHPVKNGALTPRNVVAGVRRKVWWLCEKGHEWQASIASRASGIGCPVCAGKLVISGINDFATARPELSAQWHPTKNGTLSPQMVTPMSNRKVWWLCEKGHSYQAAVAARVTRKVGCPYCANKKVLEGFNDLATIHPEIAAQWHPKKNSRKPSEILAGSHAKAWWLCPMGHTYEAVICVRTLQHTGCPVCANKIILPEENSLAARFPMIAAEWHPEKNGKRRPETLAAGSDLRVWWRCSEGHEWSAKISERTQRNSGCPYCMNRRVLAGFNDLATTHPKIAAQWHPTMNGKLTPKMFTYGSMQPVWWICEEGHVWKAPISRRAGVQKSGCPICAGRISMTRRRYYANILEEATLAEKTATGEAAARSPDAPLHATGPPKENSG